LVAQPPERCVVVLYVLFVGVLNVCLGFAVASYLGRRCRDLVREDFLSDLPRPADDPETGDGEPPTSAQAQPSVPADEGTVKPNLEQSAAGSEAASPSGILAAEMVDELLGGVRDFRARLDEAELTAGGSPARLAPPDRQTWLGSLLEATEDYTQHRNALESDFQAALEDVDADLERDPLWSVWMRQAEQIRRISEGAEQLAAEPEEERGWEEMGQRTSELLASTNELGELLEHAGKVPRAVTDSGAPPASGSDEPAAVEAILGQWAEVRPNPDALPCVALLDVDRVDQINQRYGRGVTDHMLDAVWKLVQGEQRHGATASRVNPQRFALLFADPDARRAANIVERLRQTIAKMHFVHGERETRVSVSCGLSGPTPGDEVEGLVARAGAALDEAKRYGRNRTFLHRGDLPAPVVPPTLSIEDTRVSV